MKILILNGSPRLNGNTVSMIDAFKEVALKNGHQVDIVNAYSKNINSCRACEYCHTKGNGECIQNDDMKEIYPLLKEAEILVLASPVYYLTMSSQLQMVIQRMYCMMQPPKVKKMALLLSSHSPKVYDGAVSQYKSMTGFFNVEDLGVITAFGEENKSEAKLQEVRKLAEKIK